MRFDQWRIQGRGPERPSPLPPFLDQTETQRAENFFFVTVPPPYLRLWMTVPPPPFPQPPYLKVWIRHC